MSIKKTSLESPTWLKYFIILSLLIHVVLMWSLLIMGEDGGLLARKKAPVKKPVYVQVIELPPDYKAPQSSKSPPKQPKRYADRTSVVEEENIPGNKAAIISPTGSTRAKQAARDKKTSKASKAAKAVKTRKKSTGAAKPRRVFKTKQNKPQDKTAKKKATTAKEKRPAKDTKPTKKTASIKEARLKPPLIKPVSEGDIILKSSEKKPPKEKSSLKKTEKNKDITTAKQRKKVRRKTDSSELWRSEAGQSAAAGSRQSPLSRPNLLLSDRQITELARRYEGSAPASKSKTLMLNTSELKYQNYLIELKHKIEQYWEYPRIAAMRGWEGKLFIDMTIQRDGTLSKIKLSRSSRYTILDDAAITAIKLASPFTTFPKDFDVNEIKIHGQFVYSLIGP